LPEFLRSATSWDRVGSGPAFSPPNCDPGPVPLEHAVDLDTDILVAATIHPGTAADTATVIVTAIDAAVNLGQSDRSPTSATQEEREKTGFEGWSA